MELPDYAVFLKNGKTAYVSGEPGRSDDDPGWIVFFGDDEVTTGMFPEADVAFIRIAERREPLIVDHEQEIPDQQLLVRANVTMTDNPNHPQWLEVEFADGAKHAYRVEQWSPHYMGGTGWQLTPA